MTFHAGEHIASAAERLVAEAVRRQHSVTGTFNDIVLRAEPTSTPADVQEAFDRDMAASAEAYRNSPKGRADAERSATEVKSAQAKADDLVAGLATLDFSNAAAVIDWITAMQAPSDRMGVTLPKNDILIRFAQHGWRPGMNVGADFRENDPDNFAHYIVGQALDTLSNVSIHPIVHKFADEWRSRFKPG